MNKYSLSLSLICISGLVSAQDTSTSSPSSLLLYGLVGLCAVLILWAMLSIASNLLKIEASKYGLDPEKNNIGIFPRLADFFKPTKPSYISEGTFHLLNKGYDIRLAGKADGEIQNSNVARFALNPKDFHGMSPIPKVEVEVGNDIQAGDVIFYDKKRPEVLYVSSVSGEVVEIRRGEKRSIAEVVILADKKFKYKKHKVVDYNSIDRESLVNFLLQTGLWPLINERPFDVVPEASSIPTNIFISTFDTAPLAPDSNVIIQGNEKPFHKGLEVLSKLTTGKVHLGLDGRGGNAPASAFVDAPNVEKHWFKGPHPAGNVGIQIHHVAPITGNNKVWTLGIQEVITIGQLFITGEFHADRIIALTGAELKQPKLVKTFQGASMGELLKDNVLHENVRIVSGDVLSGKQSSVEGFVGFRDDQVTVIKEGNEYELFGWLLPISPRPSISGTIPAYGKDHEFEADTNTHGEKRAFVVSGQYESVLPMDIYPQHLMKAIITNDIEKMEGLGLVELSEEDIALCEFVCTSKNPLQSLLRQGLETLKEQSI